MNRNTIRLFLCAAVAASIPQAQAQYAGTLPADKNPISVSSTSSASSTTSSSALNSSILLPYSASKNSGKPAVSVSASSLPSKLDSSLSGSENKLTQVFNPNSGKLFSAASVSSMRPLSRGLMGRTPPPGSKKGHWVDAPMYSMMGTPSWVEDPAQ